MVEIADFDVLRPFVKLFFIIIYVLFIVFEIVFAEHFIR